MHTFEFFHHEEIEVLKSRFIGLLWPISKKSEVVDKLKLAKEMYPKARHYCYAYKCGIDRYASSDGEPHNTFAKPVLELFDKKDIDYCLLIVVRYFGGTLLGAGRLLRTYVDIANLTLNNAKKVQLIDGYKYNLIVKYEKLADFKNDSDIKIIDEKHHDEDASITIMCLNQIVSSDGIKIVEEEKIKLKQ